MLLNVGRAGGRTQPEEEAISNPKWCIGNATFRARWGDVFVCVCVGCKEGTG